MKSKKKLLLNQYPDLKPEDLVKLATPFDSSFYDQDAVKVTRSLLGSILVRRIGIKTLAGFIVEAEAYRQNERACHAHKGRTKRTEVMFGPGGQSYIYFIYGVYWCLNATSEPDGVAAASLIRAIEPICGLDTMRKLRKKDKATDLCSGPGKLCMAFDLNRQLNNHDLSKPPLQIVALPDNLKPHFKGRKSGRIGISEAKDLQYRYYVQDNPHVSK